MKYLYIYQSELEQKPKKGSAPRTERNYYETERRRKRRKENATLSLVKRAARNVSLF